MKAKDIANQILKAVKTHGEDVELCIDGDDILIVKCWSGCEGSGDIVETIHTIEDDEEGIDCKNGGAE